MPWITCFLLLTFSLFAHAEARKAVGNFEKKQKNAITCHPSGGKFPKVQLARTGAGFTLRSFQAGMFSSTRTKIPCTSTTGGYANIKRLECKGQLNGLDIHVVYYEHPQLNYGPIRVTYDQWKGKVLQGCELEIEGMEGTKNLATAPDFTEIENEFNRKGIANMPKQKETTLITGNASSVGVTEMKNVLTRYLWKRDDEEGESEEEAPVKEERYRPAAAELGSADEHLLPPREASPAPPAELGAPDGDSPFNPEPQMPAEAINSDSPN